MSSRSSQSQLLKEIDTLENAISQVRLRLKTVLKELEEQTSSGIGADDDELHRSRRLKRDLHSLLASFPQVCQLLSSISEVMRHRSEDRDSEIHDFKLEDEDDEEAYAMFPITPDFLQKEDGNDKIDDDQDPLGCDKFVEQSNLDENQSTCILPQLVQRQTRKRKCNPNVSYYHDESSSSPKKDENSDVDMTETAEIKIELESDNSDEDEKISDFITDRLTDSDTSDYESLNKHQNAIRKSVKSRINADDVGKYVCQICSDVSSSKEADIKNHVLMKHPMSYFAQFGGKEESEEEWLKYINISQDGTVNDRHPYKCPICEKPCTRRDIVRDHLPTHNGISDQRIQCSYCSQQLKTPTSLRAHLRRMHPHRRPRRHAPTRVKISSAPKQKAQKTQRKVKDQTESSSNISKRQRPIQKTKLVSSKTVPNPNSFPCSICNQHLATRYSLEEHMRRHEGTKPLNCPHPGCGKSFRQLGSLSNHIEGVHAVTEKYECKICGRKFRWRRSHAIHVETHNENRQKLLCNMCPLLFLNLASLKRHIAAVHLHERPFPCHICQKSFKQRSNLNYHLNTHNNPGGRQRGLNQIKELC